MMQFYGEMPDSYKLVLNTAHPVIESILTDDQKASAEALQPIADKIKGVEDTRSKLVESHKDKKEEEIPVAEKAEQEKLDKELETLHGEKVSVIRKYAGKDKRIKQMIDLALLANNMLKGKELAAFVKRSIDLM